MSIRIGDEAPDFTAETTKGTIHFHEWIGGNPVLSFEGLYARLYNRARVHGQA